MERRSWYSSSRAALDQDSCHLQEYDRSKLRAQSNQEKCFQHDVHGGWVNPGSVYAFGTEQRLILGLYEANMGNGTLKWAPTKLCKAFTELAQSSLLPHTKGFEITLPGTYLAH